MPDRQCIVPSLPKLLIMTPNRMGAYFEEFVQGETIRHALSKTVTESDNNLFSLMTMNHHPVHLDNVYASDNQHGRILVVGTYVFSLVVGLTVSDISGLAIANLGYKDVVHLAPVFIGDTLRARSEVLEKRESNTRTDRGVIQVQTYGTNQNGVDVIRLQRSVLLKKRPV